MAKTPKRKLNRENCSRLSPNCHRRWIDPRPAIRLPWVLSISSPHYETAATGREVLSPVSETGGDHLGSFAPPAGRRPGNERASGGRCHRNQRAGTSRG